MYNDADDRTVYFEDEREWPFDDVDLSHGDLPDDPALLLEDAFR